MLQVLCCVLGTLWCCTGRKCCCHCECCVLLFCGCYVPVSVAVCGVALDASVVTTLPTNIGLSSSNSFPSSSFGSVQACHLHKKLKSKIWLLFFFRQLCGLDPSTYLLHTISLDELNMSRKLHLSGWVPSGVLICVCMNAKPLLIQSVTTRWQFHFFAFSLW